LSRFANALVTWSANEEEQRNMKKDAGMNNMIMSRRFCCKVTSADDQRWIYKYVGPNVLQEPWPLLSLLLFSDALPVP